MWHHGWSGVLQIAAYKALICILVSAEAPRGSRRARIILSWMRVFALWHIKQRLGCLMFLCPPLFCVSWFNRRPQCRPSYLHRLSFMTFTSLSLSNKHTCAKCCCLRNHRHIQISPEMKLVSLSIVVLIVSRSILLWADGGNGIHVSLSCIFNGLHSLYIKKKRFLSEFSFTSVLLQCFLSPPFSILAKDIWHGAGEQRFDY